MRSKKFKYLQSVPVTLAFRVCAVEEREKLGRNPRICRVAVGSFLSHHFREDGVVEQLLHPLGRARAQASVRSDSGLLFEVMEQLVHFSRGNRIPAEGFPLLWLVNFVQNGEVEVSVEVVCASAPRERARDEDGEKQHNTLNVYSIILQQNANVKYCNDIV